MATQGVPTWSTTAASNASADPTVNWAEGMPPSAVNDSARYEMASVAKWRDDITGKTTGLTTGGSSTAYTVTTNSTFVSASEMSGAIFMIIPHTTSGASPTLAVDGLTARALNVSTGIAVPTGALISGTPYQCRYVHGTTEFIVLNPSIQPLTAVDIIGGANVSAPAGTDRLVMYDASATANKSINLLNFLTIVSALTEDTTPDASADFLLTYDASATAAKKVLLGNFPSSLPRGWVSGCTLSNGSDTTNDINIAAGKCRDSTDTVDIVVSANTSGKQLDSIWVAAATTNSGMRNSVQNGGSIADGTYHIYAARTAASSAATIYAYFGAAGTDPDSAAAISTMLTALQAESGGASYVYARRIGSIIRSTTILGFIQTNRQFRLKTPIRNFSATVSTTYLQKTVTVPLGPKVLAFGNLAAANGCAANVRPVGATDGTPAFGSAPHGNAGTATGVGSVLGPWQCMTDTSGQIEVAQSASSTMELSTQGWFDYCGMDS